MCAVWRLVSMEKMCWWVEIIEISVIDGKSVGNNKGNK
jgi:hypothetical protein